MDSTIACGNCGTVAPHFRCPLTALATRITEYLASMGAPLADFLDSWKPGDLDDLAPAVGITVAQAEAARAYMGGVR